MATSKRLGWQKLFLILKVLTCCSGLQVSIPTEKYEAKSGGEITMTCSFTPAMQDFKTIFIQWQAFPDDPSDPTQTVASFFLDQPIDISPAYEGRAFLEVDINKRESTLRLTKLTAKDSRSFQCSVNIPGDDEGITTASTALLVLVPPSKPICNIQGAAEYWQDISLTCMSEEGSPKPTYQWQSYSVENIPRQFPPKTTDKNGVLSLFNISRETSGFYICTSTNQIDSASCNVTLAVMPGSMNLGSTAGIVGGVFAGLLVLVILICCCCRKKSKKDKSADVENEFHDIPEAGEQYSDDKSRATKQNPSEYNDIPENLKTNTGAPPQMPEDQGKGRQDGAGSDAESHSYRDSQQNSRRGSSDHLDSKRDHYAGSREHLDDERDRIRGSRDQLEDKREGYRGSRDRLEDNREAYRGSRDRLEDNREGYRGSRDRLNDNREGYRGSRDQLNDNREGYRGSRDQLNDNREGYRGSRDRLEDTREGYRGSRDRLQEQHDRNYGSRDRLEDRYRGSRERLDDRSDHYDRGYYDDRGNY